MIKYLLSVTVTDKPPPCLHLNSLTFPPYFLSHLAEEGKRVSSWVGMWPPAKVNPPPESAGKPLFESHSKYTEHALKQITTAMRLFYCQRTVSRRIWAPERLLTTTTKSALFQPKNNQHGNRQLVYSPTIKPQASYMIKTSIQRQHAEG